jgi:pimeloyl-ACP methyl ester carboxylesterase
MPGASTAAFSFAPKLPVSNGPPGCIGPRSPGGCRDHKNFSNLDENLGTRISEEAVRDAWNTAVAASPVGTIACVATWHTDFRADLPKIDVPVLVMHGSADRVLPIEACGQRTHEAWLFSLPVLLYQLAVPMSRALGAAAFPACGCRSAGTELRCGEMLPRVPSGGAPPHWRVDAGHLVAASGE